MSRPAANGSHEGLDANACTRAWCVLRTAHARVNECLDDALAETCGLGVSDFEVLMFLQDAAPGERRIGDLAAAAPLSQPALSRLVARLHERGLIDRTKGSDDQRAVLVTLTAAGREMLQRAMPLLAACVHRHLLGQLGAADHATLVAILSRIR